MARLGIAGHVECTGGQPVGQLEGKGKCDIHTDDGVAHDFAAIWLLGLVGG